MRRVNVFTVVPLFNADEELLRRLLDASASLWNQLNYERRQHFTDLEIDESVWDTKDYRKQYIGVLGSATAQQVIRKNDEAWRSFFSLKEQGEATGLPGYWGNKEEGRELRTYICDVAPEERLRRGEVRVAFESTRTRERVLMANRVLGRTAIWTLLAGPSFTADFGCGRLHGPYASSGTTTLGRRHHTLTVPTRSIPTRKLPPGNQRS